MDIKELIELAKGLDSKDKQQLILFLQSETKGGAAPSRVIDEIQEQKNSEKGRRKITERKPRKRGGKAKHRGISNDQVCVMVARDRQKMTFSGVLGRGRIRTTKLDEAIGSHLSNSNVLCTDSWRAFSSYANQKGLAHYRFKSDGKQRVKGVYHIQNVNSYHSRLKKWRDRFNGVATKYLEHYLA